MKIIKTVAMVALAAGICGTSAYAAGHIPATADGASFAVAGFILIALSSARRRGTRRRS